MSLSDQIDTLQEQAADLKSSFERARHETNEQVKARIDQVKPDIAARNSAVKEKAEHATGRAQSKWKSMQADAAAKMQDLHHLAVDQARLAVLAAIDARTWAGARAAASQPG